MEKLIKTNRIRAGRLFLNLSLLIIIFLFSSESFSQQSATKASDAENNNFKEELFIRTDRDIYITGEEVHLKIYKLSGITGEPINMSKVIYLELLDKNNFPLKQLKIKSDDISGSSGFILPENISSGNYLIRAYTSWMKNFPSERFFYRTISVINPFETLDHLNIPPDSKAVPPVLAKDGTIQLNITDESGKKLTGELLNKTGKQIKYSINLSKTGYVSREKVILGISAADLEGKPVESELTISVVKSAVMSSEKSLGFYLQNHGNSQMNKSSQQEQLAELEGHLISGYLRLKSTDEPLKKVDLSLSFVGKSARCQFGKTDENGEFHFIIKETGLNEIVIQPLSPDITGYYIELNQPFSSSFSKYKPAAFYLDSSKIEALNKVIIGMQVNNVYQPFRQKMQEEQKTSSPDFYGKPENTIKMSDYIELTTVREVVKEILPNVYTLRQNGKYDFKLINKFRGQPFENKPLILMDGVPVYDIEKVLSLNSKDIEKADIINTRYFFSDYVFDGILSFVTKKGNLDVLEFDNSIFRQVYEGCQVPYRFYSPDYSTDTLKNNRIADYRNTLYWNPDVHTGKDGKAEVSFFTSDESSEYTIIVEGISEDGKNGYTTSELKVK